jgi:hypothetical protein
VHENASVLASFVACLELALSLAFSKRRQGLTGLAPTKALKTVSASAAGAAARHAGWLASSQDAPERGGLGGTSCHGASLLDRPLRRGSRRAGGGC